MNFASNDFPDGFFAAVFKGIIRRKFEWFRRLMIGRLNQEICISSIGCGNNINPSGGPETVQPVMTDKIGNRYWQTLLTSDRAFPR